jgi:hypothetical protein
MGSIGVELFDDVIVGEYFHRRTNIQPRRLYTDLRTYTGWPPGWFIRRCRHSDYRVPQCVCTRQRLDMNSIMQVLHARPRPLNIILTESIQCIRPH